MEETKFISHILDGEVLLFMFGVVVQLTDEVAELLALAY